MQTIRFDEQDKEKGLRIVILNGMVEYTEEKGVYRVPNYVLELLKASKTHAFLRKISDPLNTQSLQVDSF
jgi:hypothetical protein